MTKKQKKSEWISSKKSGFYDSNAKEKPAKVRITTHLDSDILQCLKDRAALVGEGYQTLLNKLVRELFNLKK